MLECNYHSNHFTFEPAKMPGSIEFCIASCAGPGSEGSNSRWSAASAVASEMALRICHLRLPYVRIMFFESAAKHARIRIGDSNDFRSQSVAGEGPNLNDAGVGRRICVWFGARTHQGAPHHDAPDMRRPLQSRGAGPKSTVSAVGLPQQQGKPRKNATSNGVRRLSVGTESLTRVHATGR